MADTIRSYSDLLTALFQDGQAAGAITPQDVRDLIVSIQDDVGKRGGLTTRKTANETVNNSAALQNDDHLFQALGANETWQFEFVISYNSVTVPDFKLALIVPAGATLRANVAGLASNGSSGTAVTGSAGPIATANSLMVSLTASGEYAVLCGAWSGTGGVVPTVARISGTVCTAGTAGNLQLQWAQNSAHVSDTTVYTDSYLIARKVA